MTLKTQFRPSYWEHDTYLAPYDVAIIGGGIVGLNAAIALRARHRSLRVIVIERGVHPIGASTRNAGFACFGSISEVLSDIRTIGYESAIELFIKRKRGLERLFEIVDPRKIGYQHFGGNEIFLEGEDSTYNKCIAILPQLNKDLSGLMSGEVFVPADGTIASHGFRKVRHLIAHPMEGQLHPGKLVQALTLRASELGVSFANGITIEGIDEDDQICTLRSDQPDIQARNILVASNGFASDLIGGIEVVPARNQVFVTRPIHGLKLKGCFHYHEGFVYFRNVEDRILIGGARHVALEEERTSAFGLTDKVMNWLQNFLVEHLDIDTPEVEFAWSGILGIGTAKQPIVKMASARIGVAVRLGGMGVAIGSLVGQDAADLIEQRL